MKDFFIFTWLAFLTLWAVSAHQLISVTNDLASVNNDAIMYLLKEVK